MYGTWVSEGCVFLHMYGCIHAQIYVYVSAHACMFMQRPESSLWCLMFFRGCPSCFLRQALILAWNFPSRLSFLPASPRDPPVCTPLVLRLCATTTTPGMRKCELWRLNSGPQALGGRHLTYRVISPSTCRFSHRKGPRECSVDVKGRLVGKVLTQCSLGWRLRYLLLQASLGKRQLLMAFLDLPGLQFCSNTPNFPTPQSCRAVSSVPEFGDHRGTSPPGCCISSCHSNHGRRSPCPCTSH